MMDELAVSPFDEVVDQAETAALQASPSPADPAAAPAKTRRPRKSPSRPDPQTITVKAGTQDLLAIRLVVNNAATGPGSARVAAGPRRLGGVVRGPSGSGDVAVAAVAAPSPEASTPAATAAPMPVLAAAAAAAQPAAAQQHSVAKAQTAAAQPAPQPGTIVIHIPAKTVVLGGWAIIIVGFLALMGGGL